MAQNNFHLRMESSSGYPIARTMVRSRGDNGLMSLQGWVKDMNFVGTPEIETEVIGRKTPVITMKFDEVTLVMIPILDDKFQCPECGYPRDAPNINCYCEDGCLGFREEEPEAVLDLDEAQRKLREMFS